MRRRVCVFLVTIAVATVSYGFHWDIVQPHAPAKTLEPPEIGFAVGCELRGCCVGCPAGLPVDLRVTVDLTITKHVALHVDNLDAVGFDALQISGNARLEGTTIIAGPGESTISGFPDSPDHPTVSIRVRPAIDSEKWIAIGRAARGLDRPRSAEFLKVQPRCEGQLLPLSLPDCRFRAVRRSGPRRDKTRRQRQWRRRGHPYRLPFTPRLRV